MAQFRSTADILDAILINGGEVTNGNSSFETQVLNYLNRVHFTLIAGGTIPIGKDTSITIDELWPWARAKRPTILELQPKVDTGTITLTNGAETGTFSSAPASSVKGWFLKVDGREEWFRIAKHDAADTAFELDANYTGESGSGLNFIAVKLDYELVPSHIVVDTNNNKFQFQKVSGTTLTATLTSGVYTPSDLATHIGTQATTAASGPTITASYSSVTRKFSITSNLASATSFYIVGNGDQSGFSIHKDLGFDDETSSASAATHTSTYVLGGLCRLVEPLKVHRGSSREGSVYGTDTESFQRNYPFTMVEEGIPDRFCVIHEDPNGIFTVRFNKYPKDETRIEVEHVAIPRDLKDNSSSIPLVPRKHVDVLEDAATFYLLLNKNDDRAQVYAQLMQGKLNGMVAQHRGSLVRSGENFGRLVPRVDLVGSGRRRLIYGERD